MENLKEYVENDTALIDEAEEAIENEEIKEDVQDEDSLVLVFEKPYLFEGVTYTEVDLSGLEDVSAAGLAAVSKILQRKGIVSHMPEMTLDFSIHLAARVAKLPADFFMRLPARDTIKLKNMVTGFLYGEDGKD